MIEELREFLQSDPRAFPGYGPLEQSHQGELVDDGMLKTCLSAIEAFLENDPEREIDLIRSDGPVEKVFGQVPADFLIAYANLGEFLKDYKKGMEVENATAEA